MFDRAAGRGIALAGLALAAALSPGPAGAVEVSGFLAGEVRAFGGDPSFARQRRHSMSFAARPEFYQSWDNGDQSVLFVPFARLDSADSERTHMDVRELWWQKVAHDWELRVGLGKVFWGVTESRHLVDIVNQTDRVENVDAEDKLGQPMLDFALIRDWGTLNLFVLPGFRERTFPGPEGRLRGSPRVDTSLASFDSGARTRHVDLALRWSHFIGAFDIGISHFYGTGREPRLVPRLDAGGAPVLAPHYDLIHQTGVDLQATLGSWLWKLEGIRRGGQGKSYLAAVAGFEYTVFGVSGSAADLGVLLEYLYDGRGAGAPQPFEDDLFAGVRLAFNDVQGSELLAGFILDLDADAVVFNLEASRRIGDRWTLEAEMRAWGNVASTDPLVALRNDDHLQITLSRYF